MATDVDTNARLQVIETMTTNNNVVLQQIFKALYGSDDTDRGILARIIKVEANMKWMIWLFLIILGILLTLLGVREIPKIF